MTQRADLLFLNARVLTQDEHNPECTQLAIAGNRILAAGNDLHAFHEPSTRVVDVRGSAIVPGFQDAHLHFLGGGSNLLSIPIHLANSRETFSQLITKQAEQTPDGHWITGGGWDVRHFPGRALPQRSWLDYGSAKHPILLHQYDGHAAVCNSRALELAGISAATPDPPGGSIDRDEHGEPTGVLRDAAMSLVTRIIPPMDEAAMIQAIETAQDHLLAHGITAGADMHFEWDQILFLEKMAKQGRLKIRLAVYAPVLAWDRIKNAVENGLYQDDWFQFAGLKTFSDGSLGSLTALMLEAYDSNAKKVGLRDKDWLDPERLAHIFIEADALGVQHAVHAIGDRANREVLDLFQQVVSANGSRDRRLRIEHAQHIHPDDLARFAELGAIASIQPSHIEADIPILEQELPDRQNRAYPFHSLLRRNVTLAMGSDWPVVAPDPLRSIHAAIHRFGWQQYEGLDLAAALCAHTHGAALSTFRESIIGKLAPGMLADFVILDPRFLKMDQLDSADATFIQDVYVNGKSTRT